MTTVSKTARKIKPTVQCPATPPVADIRVHNHGSIFLFAPTNSEAFATLVELCPRSDYLYFGGALVVEHRYAEAVADQMRDDGLTVT